MMSHYSHVRKQARRAALDRLCEKTASGDGDTAQPTAQLNQDGAEPFSQVIERNGGDDETRTRDLCRDSVAWIGFTTTYKTAGTAKVPLSRTRHQDLWVGLWVGNSAIKKPARFGQR
jgi:hypothetical protein